MSGIFDILKPVAEVGSLLFAYNQGKKNIKQLNDVQNTIENEDAARKNAAMASSASSSGAAAAIQRQTESNRLKALRKAVSDAQAGFDKSRSYLEPYYNSGVKFIPQKEKQYGESLKITDLLSAYMQSPEYLQKLNQSKASFNVDLPVPDYLKGKV